MLQPLNKTLPFVKVKDPSRRPIRGLYQRGPSLYARIAFHGRSFRVRLSSPPFDIPGAKAELAKLRAEGPVPTLAGGTFTELAEHYLTDKANKKEKTTMASETSVVRGILIKHFGDRPIAKITSADIDDFRTLRLAQGRSKNTVNKNVFLARNIFRHAIGRGAVREDPTAKIHNLKFKREQKDFVPFDHIRKATDWLRVNQKVGDLIADAVLFLAYTGARFTGGMNVRWENVAWDQQKVCIPINKNRKPYWVDFNPDLRAHLEAIHKKRGPNPTGLIFPTYRTPTQADDKPFKNLREAMLAACVALHLPRFTPHDLRHHFASRCVMAGIDFKQIADWLGHSDGGVLVATVYGHHAKGHGQAAAARLPSVNG